MRTIGEVSAALGIKPHVLRYWEQQFPNLQPLKRSGGRRLYRPEDVALIKRIKQLVNQDGYTLKGANAALANGSKQAPVGQIGEAVAAAQHGATMQGRSDNQDILLKLRAIRMRLANALAA